MSERYWFCSGKGSVETARKEWSEKLANVLQKVDGHAHQFRDTLAVELPKAEVPIERVSILLVARACVSPRSITTRGIAASGGRGGCPACIEPRSDANSRTSRGCGGYTKLSGAENREHQNHDNSTTAELSLVLGIRRCVSDFAGSLKQYLLAWRGTATRQSVVGNLSGKLP